MDLKREYIVIMLDENNHETYEYFSNKEKSIEYAKSVESEYKGVVIKEVDYEENTEEIIWESGDE